MRSIYDLDRHGSIFEDRDFCCAAPVMANGDSATPARSPYEPANPAGVISSPSPQGTDIITLAQLQNLKQIILPDGTIVKDPLSVLADPNYYNPENIPWIKGEGKLAYSSPNIIPGPEKTELGKTAETIQEKLKEIGLDLKDPKSLLILGIIVGVTLYIIL